MLIGIMADLHSNIEATKAVLKALDDIGPERIICLGDIVGYNADPNAVIDIIRERTITRIIGNHDAIVSGLEDPSFFYSSKALVALEWHLEHVREDNRQWLAKAPKQAVFEEQFLAVHGAPSDRDAYINDWLDAMREFAALDGTGTRVCFFGHSHRPSIFGEYNCVATTAKSSKLTLSPSNRYLINPGSVGQPRDHDPRAAFGLFDTEAMTFEFCRVEYDVASVARKVIAAGLPKKLAERLFKGR